MRGWNRIPEGDLFYCPKRDLLVRCVADHRKRLNSGYISGNVYFETYEQDLISVEYTALFANFLAPDNMTEIPFIGTNFKHKNDSYHICDVDKNSICTFMKNGIEIKKPLEYLLRDLGLAKCRFQVRKNGRLRSQYADRRIAASRRTYRGANVN